MAGDHTPTATDWYTATWRTVGSLYQVGVLVGPGGLVLPVGTYTVWVKVESTPTVVARPAGTLTIY
jgi:hypothetical protein